MKKDAYYFPHFCNARHDRKLKRVQKELGVEGYGIYFMILEVLRDQQSFKYPLADIDLLADEFGTSEQKINTVVCNYKLFEIDSEKNFTSHKLQLYLQPYLERSEKARNAAITRWTKVKSDAQALPEHSTSNAQAMQVKETKVKQSEVKESKVHPFETHLINTMKEKNLSTYLEKITEFYNYRMAMKKKDQYQTEKGINGLIRNVLELKDSSLDVNDSLEYAMEKNWKSPELKYFNTGQAGKQKTFDDYVNEGFEKNKEKIYVG